MTLTDTAESGGPSTQFLLPDFPSNSKVRLLPCLEVFHHPWGLQYSSTTSPSSHPHPLGMAGQQEAMEGLETAGPLHMQGMERDVALRLERITRACFPEHVRPLAWGGMAERCSPSYGAEERGFRPGVEAEHCSLVRLAECSSSLQFGLGGSSPASVSFGGPVYPRHARNTAEGHTVRCHGHACG